MNTREGLTRELAGPHESRADAIADGARIARHERAEHVIHNADGTVFEITQSGG